eukprot:CAMPEP_0179128636 /NCGR_PEP_ID=MMETSP0796-20121207/61001_1 /TAXON_ID=73915 /ORGANISM="Pyrodinium bahamense, Strain pbaha01" /LENGTH=369 /DNA_ID=CAMNT_0020827491 /DNA_START=1 /DNA_END=1110 /DNA_ORIENTATION=+
MPRMSSAAMKRPAAAPAGSAAKRRAAALEAGPAERPAFRESSILRQCGAVAQAVRATPGFPMAVLEILGRSIENSLGVAKDRRHPFQEQVASMVGEVLAVADCQLAEQVSVREATLVEVDSEKATRAAAEQAALEELGGKEGILAEAQEAADKSAGARTAAEEALFAAEATAAEGEADLEAALALRAKLQAAVDQSFVPLKEGSVEAAQAQVCAAAVLAVGHEFSFDPTLLSALPTALLKAPGMRGNFDGLIFQEAALEAARAGQREALAARRAATKATQQLGPELRRAGADLHRARARLEALRLGPLATYRELLERREVPEAPKGAAAESIRTAEMSREETEEAGLATETAPGNTEEAAPQIQAAPAE